MERSEFNSGESSPISLIECKDFYGGQEAWNLWGQFGSRNPRVLYISPVKFRATIFLY
jgi:ATP sulfurylase